MGGFGNYPTRYSNLTNDQLYAKYFENWNTMKPDEKLDLLQETVNRDAAEKGMIGAPHVTFADLAWSVEGQQRNGVISVNRELVLDGTRTVEYQGQTISKELEDANLRAMTVCFHENAHAYQEQCIAGMIPCADPELLAQYKANDFDVTPVFDENGQIQRGLQYMRGEKNYYFYYLQATERDAYKISEAKTQSIMQHFSERFGGERFFQAYAKELQTNGYQATELRAACFFQNPNIEKEINRVLTNEFYNRDLPVTPELERAVRAEMIASYQKVFGEVMQTALQQQGAGSVSSPAQQTGVQPLSGTMQQTGTQPMSGMMQQSGMQPMSGMKQQGAGSVSSPAQQTGVQPLSGTMQQTGTQPMSGMMQQSGMQPMSGMMQQSGKQQEAGAAQQPGIQQMTDAGFTGQHGSAEGNSAAGITATGLDDNDVTKQQEAGAAQQPGIQQMTDAGFTGQHGSAEGNSAAGITATGLDDNDVTSSTGNVSTGYGTDGGTGGVGNTSMEGNSMGYGTGNGSASIGYGIDDGNASMEYGADDGGISMESATMGYGIDDGIGSEGSTGGYGEDDGSGYGGDDGGLGDDDGGGLGDD